MMVIVKILCQISEYVDTVEEWLETYNEYLRDEQKSYEEVKEYIRPYIPKKLYRYRKFDKYLDSNLEGEVFLANPSVFNDPFDCAISINYVEALLNISHDPSLTQEECEEQRKKINKVLSKELSKDYPKINKELKKHYDTVYNNFKNTINIACFTTELDNRLMWSHYTENHRGYCIEYDTQHDIFRKMLLPIIYTDTRYDCSVCLKKDEGQLKNICINTAFYKDSVWGYEKEWRMYATTDYIEKTENPVKLKGVISAIYLGVHSEEVDKEKIRKFAEENKVPVYQMEMSNEKYTMYQVKAAPSLRYQVASEGYTSTNVPGT